MTRRSISLPCLLLCLLFTAFVNSLFAAIPVVHLSAKPKWLNSYKNYDKQIPLRDVENGYFYQLLEEQINIESKADYSHIVRQIVSGAGIQNGSEISVSFDPTYERLDFHEIIVWRDNKPQNRLSVAAFKVIADETELSKFIYQGTYSAYCILKDIRKGDRIEYSYTLTGRNPILGNKYCRDIYLQQSQPIAHIYKAILASPLRKINFRPFNKVPKMGLSVKGGMNCYEWEDFQVKPAHDYENQPGWFTSYAYVQISDFASWNEVANWALKINPVASNITGALARQIAQFRAEAGNDKEKYFRSAVKMVQDEVRYMGIEIGEYSHRANRPEAVYDQRYGDCKDKSLLLVSILKAGGIEANMVLINTGAQAKTDQYLPSAYAFDHATVVATINGKQVWVDPTIAYQRGTGVNLYYPNYGEGLVLKPDCNGLTAIPSSKKGLTDCHENYTIIKNSNNAKLDVVTTYTLFEADRMRDKIASSGISETEKSYLNYYQKTYPKIESTDSVTIKDNEAKNELVTIEHYSITDFLKTDSTSGKYEGGFYASYIGDWIPTINTKLRYPRSTYPGTINYTISAILPAPWDIEEKSNAVKKDGYTFTSKISAVNDTLILNYQFSYLKNFIPIDKLDEFATDVKQIKDNMLGYDFTYTPGTANTVFRLNYWMLFSTIVFALILGGIFIKIYRTKTPEIVFEPGANFKSIGGWLILIAIGLGASVLSLVLSLAKGTYFGLTQWNAHLHNPTDKAFKALFTFEAFGNVLLACYALFCFILLLKKRDILPRFIVGLYSFAVFFFVVDYIWAKSIFNTVSDEVVYTAVRAVVVAAIWIPYFKKSTRVEETFIVPYPSTNYRYEEVVRDSPIS